MIHLPGDSSPSSWAAQTTKPCSLKRSGRSSNFAGAFLGAPTAAAVQLGRKGLRSEALR